MQFSQRVLSLFQRTRYNSPPLDANVQDDEDEDEDGFGAVTDQLLRVSKVKIPTRSHPSHDHHHPPSRINGVFAQEMSRAVGIATSPDELYVAVGGLKGEVMLFEPIVATDSDDDTTNSDQGSESPQPRFIYQGPESVVQQLVFSADSTVLLVAWRSGKVIAFNAKDGRILHECDTPEGLCECAISNDGKRVVIGGKFGWKMFDFDNFPSDITVQEDISQESALPTGVVQFSNDDTKLIVGVSSGDKRGCYLYNSQGTKLLRSLCRGEELCGATMSHNSMILAVGCRNKVYLFNVASGECFQTFHFVGEPYFLKFSKDGKRIFFSTTSTGKMVYGYGVYSGEKEVEVSLPSTALSIDLWNEDNTLMVACIGDHVQVIDVSSVMFTIHELQYDKEVACGAVSSNGLVRAITYGSLGGLELHDTFNSELNINKSDEFGASVCVSPCGTAVVYSSSREIHVYKKADENSRITFTKTITTDSVNWFSKAIFLEGGKHILIYQKGGRLARVINIDTEHEVPITTSINIVSACIVPQTNYFVIATEDSITIHKNAADGNLNSVLTFSLSEERNGALVQAMKVTPDGSRMVLCFGSHLNIYDLDLDPQDQDPSSKLSAILPYHDNNNVVIEDVSISHDGKIIAICDKKHVYTMSLAEQVDEMKKVHAFPIGSIVSLAFLPHPTGTSEGQHCPLFVTYGKYSTTLQVNVSDGKIVSDPSLLLRCFSVCDDEAMIALIPEHKDLLYKRDEEGRILAELAIEDNRPVVLRRILEFEPSMAWSHQGVVRYLTLESKEDIVEMITTEKSAFAFSDTEDLEKLSDLIPELVENGSIETIDLLLQAGSPNAANGFASGAEMHKKAFLNRQGLIRWLSNLLLDKKKPCNGSQVVPEASMYPNDLGMYGIYDDDDKKGSLLSASRVFIPRLTSQKILQSLIDIDSSSDEQNVGKNVIPQRLKPFRSESLQASIEAAWYSWAGPMFLRRALWYILWMVCIVCHEYTSIPELKIASLVVIGLGWFYYFFIVEMKQLRRKDSLIQYFYNFWNLWQILTLFLVLVYVCLSIVDIFMAYKYSSSTTILSQQKWSWFPGLVHLFTLINFLYYCRGIKRASWILYALGVLMTKMFVFLIILLWIVMSACFQLAKVNDAFDSDQPIHVFTDTFVTAIFGAFDSAEFCSDPYAAASTVGLTLFIILSLIFVVFMNAMIAFISEEFANILDYQSAILAREMACLIVDMYDTMNVDERKRIENTHMWVYKLFKQADLDKMGSSQTDSDADGRRATKQDIQSVAVKLKKENGEMRKENREMRKGIDEVRKENGEMRKDMLVIRKEIGEMRKKEHQVTLEKIVSLLEKS